MSQDSQEIKTIEQWRWSEMQGLELVSAPAPALPDPFKTNNNHPSPTPTPTQQPTTPLATPPRVEQQDQEEAQKPPSRAHRTEAMESSEPTRDAGGGGGSGGTSTGSGEKPEVFPAVAFGELFRFADGLDYVLMTIGSLGAIVHGCSLPLFLRFFADLVNSFGSNANNMDKMMHEVLKVGYINSVSYD